MSNKSKIAISVVGVFLSLALMVATAILAENALINSAVAIAVTVLAMILILVAVAYASKIDHETGVYKCKKCGHTFKPTVKAYVFSAHTPTKRRLACPECGEKTWCIRKSGEK